MPFTPTAIHAFHRALHTACGLPALRPTMSDERVWWDFLLEMAPLDEEESGPFSEADILGAIRIMKIQRNEGKAAWALRPSTILRNPESFRDLVLEFRKDRRSRRLASRPPTRDQKSEVREQTPDAEIVTPEELSASIARMRESIRKGGSA